jgi:hypothetical protein
LLDQLVVGLHELILENPDVLLILRTGLAVRRGFLLTIVDEEGVVISLSF